jgi:hypothetical protein|tara:strand:- start:341 stop:640 length:300 start_codon:yes stop_codon:yes gene_type:complete
MTAWQESDLPDSLSISPPNKGSWLISQRCEVAGPFGDELKALRRIRLFVGLERSVSLPGDLETPSGGLRLSDKGQPCGTLAGMKKPGGILACTAVLAVG